jgi:uncharacterized protein YbbC (DUF1343 family)
MSRLQLFLLQTIIILLLKSNKSKSKVLSGIDVLTLQNYSLLENLRIGLITNPTGLDQFGTATIDLLFTHTNLKSLFSPEHGIRGDQDEPVGDSVDRKTGLPIYSLYSASPARLPNMTDEEYYKAVIRARSPSVEQLRNLDAIVYDIQDVGARFYTYIATLGGAMQVCAENKKKFVVLDRVNMVSGSLVQGPVQTGPENFVGFHNIPVRYGMTIGELAKMINVEKNFNVDLSVIPVHGWKRDQFYDQTGLNWTNPSPSIQNLNAAILYPGLCLLESTSMSMGRGTRNPFEMVGAPFVDGDWLAQVMNTAGIEGALFESVRFTPSMKYYVGPKSSLKYRDQECGGIRVRILNRLRLDVTDIGFELALQLSKKYASQFDVQDMSFLLGNNNVLLSLEKGESRSQIKHEYRNLTQDFLSRRKIYQIYPETSALM